MLDPGFVHLRVHSAYSLLEGAIQLRELPELCRRHLMPAVAVTDTNNMFAAMEFAMVASAAGIQPIIGCQLDFASDDAESGANRHVPAHRRRLDRLVLLAQDETGYRNLMQLSSDAFLASEAGEVHTTFEQLERHGDGLICLSGGPDGPLGRLLEGGQREAAAVMVRQLAGLFPGRFYVELQRHGLEIEGRIEPGLLELADAENLPLVATNDVYFAEAELHQAHDALLCIDQGVPVSEQNRRRLTANHYFRSADEMRELFSDIPEAVDNTIVIALRCAYMPLRRDPILPPFADRDGGGEVEALRTRARAGLEARLEKQVFDSAMDTAARDDKARPYRDQLDFELGVIIDMGFPGYFLIVADFIQWAKEQDIPVGPGRGSGAGSVVSWALAITDLDPLRFGLLFERFLNPERVSMPDFDIDFCQDGRDRVIEYVRRKYGADRVANIITFGTLQARAVLRDVGRVLGMPYRQVDEICKMVPFNPARPPKLQEAIDAEPDLQEMRRDDESVAQLIDISLKLEGLYRHASTHAAGVIIGDRPLTELVPLYRDPREGQLATQFSMKYAEAAGLVKFDFLGLKTLTVLQKACELVADRGEEVELDSLPLDDPATYELLGRGDTVGIFQLESGGMRDALRQMKPDSFEDIIALVSLYRPGPMDNIPRYIACKHGEEEPDYLHPDLQPVLEETFGVIIYQEQVMEIAKILSGYSLGGADLLRRAMGKKIKSEMEAQRQVFVNGAVARGVERGRASTIFDLVDKFAGYGFNKSHAAAYALVAYQTAWLKAHYPVEFLAASMTLDYGNTDKLGVFRQELARLGIELLPPDINRSQAFFSVEPVANGGVRHAMRYALAAIRNVGAKAMEEMVEERDRNGPYRSLTDFASRLGADGANKRQLENLARAGAFDSLDTNRGRLHEGAEHIVRFAASAEAERSSGQANLFGSSDSSAESEVGLWLPDCPDWPTMERLANEYEAVGCYLSAHPLDRYTHRLRRLGVTLAKDVASLAAGAETQMAGVVIGCQERTSNKGERYAFVKFSDPSDTCEMLVSAKLLRESRELVNAGQELHVTVGLGREEGDARLYAREIRPLGDLLARDRGDVKLVVNDKCAVDGIKRILESAEPGKDALALIIRTTDCQEVELQLQGGIALTDRFRTSVENLPGVAEVLDL